MLRLIPAAVLLAALATSVASAQTLPPREVPFQGVLDDGGAPVTTATDVTFRLFEGASGGTAVWTETQTVSPGPDGAFAARLGAVTDLPDDLGRPLWLEVAVATGGGTEVLGPRTALGAAPYALGLYGLTVTPDANTFGSVYGPNLAGGSPANVIGPDIGGATISGGGGAGLPNTVTASFSTVGGGAGNTASDFAATVGGGGSNTASGDRATVGGGQGNTANGDRATVGGGEGNTASFFYATVGGGQGNTANGLGATVGGGITNTADFSYATVGGGRDNTTSRDYATVGGGRGNTAGFSYATVGGGEGNTASGFIATVGGGEGNTASGFIATVGGGQGNTASGDRATVPGGVGSEARGDYSFAAGSYARAAHDGAFVWSDNSQASADSLVSTGQDQFLVRAAGGVGVGTNAPSAQVHVETRSSSSRPHLLLDDTGASGFARLRMANANPAGAYWDLAVGGTGGDAFNVFYWDGTSGGNVVGVNAPGVGSSLITTASGASLTQGGVWANASSRALKTELLPVDGQAVLEALAEVPVTTWRYHAEAEGVRHMGPMSQDFYAAFGLGSTDEAIGTVDADGVALAAIQALHARTEAQAAEIAALRAGRDAAGAQMQAQADQIEALRARAEAQGLRLARLEALLAPPTRGDDAP